MANPTTATKSNPGKSTPNGNAAKPSTTTAQTQPAPATPSNGKRGRRKLEDMTPEQRKAWEETQVYMTDLVQYNDTDGKPNLEASRKAFDKAFAAYIVHRPTKASAPSTSNVEVFPPEMLAKIDKIAMDAFTKRAKPYSDAFPQKAVATEPFLTFIFQALGIDPFEAEEKRKSILRALTNSLGYERVKVQLTEDTKTNKKGEFVVATGKHAALYRPAK